MNKSPVILCLNSGSSSLKAALFRRRPPRGELELLVRFRAAAERSLFHLRLQDASGAEVHQERIEADDQAAVLLRFLAIARELGLPEPDAVGHRIAHGGPELSKPAVVTPGLVEQLRQVTPLAPLHLPPAVAVVEAAAAALPDSLQAACFDTAFHRRIPELNQRFPLPRRLWSEGVRRYGFHGLSYESVLDSLGAAGNGAVVIAHLGSGASLAAVRDGAPVDTTMGFTPTGGLMMGTRSGDLDPGILTYLMRRHHLGPDEIERLVNRESGLLGVSETTSGMKDLLDLYASDPRAQQAVDLFCLIVRKHIGAMAASLGGLDLLVFTAAIGESSARVRTQICQGLRHLGVELDEQENARGGPLIHVRNARCQVRVVATDEERKIAQHTCSLL